MGDHFLDTVGQCSPLSQHLAQASPVSGPTHDKRRLLVKALGTHQRAAQLAGGIPLH